MRILLKLLFFTFIFTMARVSLAAEAEQFSLKKSDINKIKILSKDQNRIHFFLTDTKSNKFRIGDLSQKDAETILASFKINSTLFVKTQPNKRGYRDVIEWRSAP